jgi:hypothetical protein
MVMLRKWRSLDGGGPAPGGECRRPPEESPPRCRRDSNSQIWPWRATASWCRQPGVEWSRPTYRRLVSTRCSTSRGVFGTATMAFDRPSLAISRGTTGLLTRRYKAFRQIWARLHPPAARDDQCPALRDLGAPPERRVLELKKATLPGGLPTFLRFCVSPGHVQKAPSTFLAIIWAACAQNARRDGYVEPGLRHGARRIESRTMSSSYTRVAQCVKPHRTDFGK